MECTKRMWKGKPSTIFGGIDKSLLGPEHNVREKDRVRSYDFPGMRDDCYVEGRVRRIGSFHSMYPTYEIVVDKTVVEGKEIVSGAGRIIHVVVNGTDHSFGGVTFGVEKI